jgi:AraC-like DNA-binding protein
MLAAYAEAARSVGIDPFRMLRKVGLPTTALEHPDFRIPAERVRQLIDISAQAAGREDFGLMVGREFKLSMKGALGLLMREQPTVRGAIEILARYLKYQDDSVEIRLEDRGDTLLFEPQLLSAQARSDRQSVEFTLAKYVQLLRALLGPSWRPQKVTFTHGPPADMAPYLDMFDRVEFGGEVNGIVLSAADISVQIPTADPDMAREIARYIERNAAQQSATMTDRVSELIKRLLPAGHCTIDRVAQHLGVDRRTVHRRLTQENKSFTQLVNDARKELVTAQLGQKDQPLGAVANLLGFSSLSTFSRWFRQTYGVPASEFRNAPPR